MLLYLFCNKSHYENVPFEIPESWCWTTLGELFDIVSAKRVLQSDWQRTGIPFYRAREIVRLSYEGYVDNDLFITEEHYNNLKKSYGVPEPSDIMLSAVGTIGRAYVVRNNDVFYYKDASVLCLRNVYHLNSEFIKWILSSDLLQNQMYENSKGTTVDTITIEKANSYFLPLPPIDEQYRIVKLLCEWDAYINDINKNKEEVLNNIRTCKSKILDLAISGKLVPQDPNDEPTIELLKRINPAFKPCDNSHYENLPENWCLAKVKDVFVINPRNKAEDNTIAGFIPMTLIDDGYSNTFSYEKRKWGAIKTGFTHFADGDVAVAKISPCLENRKSIVLRDLPNGIGAGTTELHVFRSSVVSPEYALYFFKSEYFISRCVGTFNGVVGQQRVGKNIIEEIQIPIPPINEQTKIVSTIETIFTQLNTITAEL